MARNPARRKSSTRWIRAREWNRFVRPAKNLKSHGIRVGYFLQFGYPGENWSDIERTIRMVRDTAPDDIGVSVSYPLPGTKIPRECGAELGDKLNWRIAMICP